MSRFIQPQDSQKSPPKKEQRELPKVGSYTSESLSGAKKIPTKGGYK